MAVPAPAVACAKAAAPPTNGIRAEVRARSRVSVGVVGGGSMRSLSVPATIRARRWPAGTTWSLAARSRVIVYALARGERAALAGGGVVAEVGPAAAEDRVVDGGGLGLGLLEAGAVAGGARAPAGAVGEGGDALAARRVVADGVGAEVDEDGGEVGGAWSSGSR